MAYPYRKLLKPPLGSRLNKSHKLSRGLVGFWLMNEKAGSQVFDVSGNGNTGTFGAGALSPSWAPGKFGSAVDFDGDNDEVNCGTEVFTANHDALTVVVDAYIRGGDQTYGIVATSPYYTAVDGWFFGNSHADDLERLNFSIEQDAYMFVDNGIVFNEEHQYVVRYGKSQEIAQFYRDGVLIKDGLNGGSFVDVMEAGDLTFGSDSSVANMDGKISFVRIYNRALSASEIALLYREPFCMFKSPAELAVLGSYKEPEVGNNVPVKMRTYRNFRVA